MEIKSMYPMYYAIMCLDAFQQGGGNQAMVQVALTQEGNGGETYWSWYGFTQRVEWVESRGQFRDGSYVPAVGDIVFFDWGNDGSIDHVGIVESVIDGTIYTVEGNSGDKVARRSYPIGYEEIRGYGMIKY